MIIREAELSDFKEVKRLYSHLHPKDEVLLDEIDAPVFETIVNSEYFFIFVGLIGNKMVTSCYLNIIPNMTRNISPYAIIENVVTDKMFRNNGYGKEIIKQTLETAWSQGCYKVMLQTGSKKESVHKFYKSCGFSATDKTAFVARPK